MLHTLLVLNVLCFCIATDSRQSATVIQEKRNNDVASYVSSRNNFLIPNRTFIDKSDNILKVPTISYDENIRKKKIKKSPKRTIQKIIKKNRIKRKRTYMLPVTRLPTISTISHNDDSIHSGQIEDKYTTEENQNRRQKKNSKVLRYHMPFQKLQRNTMRRNKRNTDREDVYILKDLDEIEFLGTGKDYDVVKAHVQKYWK